LRSKKLAVFGNSIKISRNQVFLIDKKCNVSGIFGQFGIADQKDMPQHSYLMEKEYLETGEAILAETGEARWLHEQAGQLRPGCYSLKR